MERIILLLCTLLAFNKLSAQQLTLKNGEIFTIEIHNTSKGKSISNDQYIFQFKVLSNDNAEYKLQCTLLKVKSQLTFSNKFIRLNSDSIRQTVFNSTAILTPIMLLERPFIVVLSPKSKLLRLEGIDELIEQTITKWRIATTAQKYIKPNLESFLSSVLKNIFFELPQEKITYRSVWTDAEQIKYEVIAIGGALLEIAAVNADKTLHAKYTLNEVTGLLEGVSVTGQYNIDNTLLHVEYSQTMSKNITPVVDTAWLNMAITMSVMSDAFRNKTGDTDSAKVFGYFRAHDELYKSDVYYAERKQYLMQTLNMVNPVYHTSDSVFKKP